MPSLPITGTYEDPRPPTDSRTASNRYYNLKISLPQAVDQYLYFCEQEQTVARVSELATMVGVSRQHLSQVAQVVFGCSIVEILRQKRLARARALLVFTSSSLEVVIRSSGFGHRSTFYRAFKRHFGVTPDDLRRLSEKSDHHEDDSALHDF